jgi:hypothetical protein
MKLRPTLGCAVAIALAATAPARAKSDISPRFDGTYAGAMVPAPALSGSACGTHTIAGVTVRNGIIGTEAGRDIVIAGLVTEEGFVRGRLGRMQAPSVLLEGHIDGRELTGGVIDERIGCAWIVKLQRG